MKNLSLRLLPREKNPRRRKKTRLKRERIWAKNFTFGTEIIVLATIRRERTGGIYHGPRWWARVPSSKELYYKRAIFLKHTMLFDGEADRDPEDGRLFYTTGANRGAWVCIEGREPERVFLDSIELRCHFGSRSDEQCKNPATYRHTPESYLKKIELNKAPRKILQREVDSLGFWCHTHKLDGMVPIDTDRGST